MESAAGGQMRVAGAARAPRLAPRLCGAAWDPVAVLDFASLYPSCFISNNMCYSMLLPPKAHVASARAHTARPTPSAPIHGWLACGVDDTRLWPGDAIAL